MMLIVTIGIFKTTFEYRPARKLEDTNSLKQQLRLFYEWVSFYFEKGDGVMEGLKISYMNGKRNPSKKRRKPKEKLSTREIEDLMGMHRPCYERRRGAIRQK